MILKGLRQAVYVSFLTPTHVPSPHSHVSLFGGFTASPASLSGEMEDQSHCSSTRDGLPVHQIRAALQVGYQCDWCHRSSCWHSDCYSCSSVVSAEVLMTPGADDSHFYIVIETRTLLVWYRITKPERLRLSFKDEGMEIRCWSGG